jgi:hypothetical protein
MPRRRGPEAELAANRARQSHWRYLLRNPPFRDDINRLLETYAVLRTLKQKETERPSEQKVKVRTQREFAEVLVGLFTDDDRLWGKLQDKMRKLEAKLTAITKPLGLYLLVSELRQGRFIDGSALGEPLPKLTPDTVVRYEKLLREDVSPVSVIDDQDAGYLSGDELGDPHTLYLSIELAHPQDVLLSLIEQRLRQVIGERSKLIKRDSGKRQRTDTADMGLAVYDQVLSGATFQKIASKLKRPVSSVKSAYLAAYRNIHGSHPPRPKRLMPLEGFDPATHFQTCKVCKNAKRPEDFCGPALAYVRQDQVSQRERPFADVGGNRASR